MNLTASAMKVILLTGATDGIGYEAAKRLVAQGNHVLIHGRNQEKLQKVKAELTLLNAGKVEAYQADLSDMKQVNEMAETVTKDHEKVDVLINNAGVFRSPQAETTDGLDLRLAVNMIAPYLLTKKLLAKIPEGGRVVNLSSAAQSSVDIQSMMGRSLSENEGYAQSKLGVIMWTNALAKENPGKVLVSLNPASFLGTKMVREAYGVPGKDLTTGVNIICEAALAESFGDSSGKYFDNDIGVFSAPHPDGNSRIKIGELVDSMNAILAGMGYN